MAVFIPLHFMVHLSMFPISIVIFLIQDFYKAVDGRSYKEIIVTYLNEPED